MDNETAECLVHPGWSNRCNKTLHNKVSNLGLLDLPNNYPVQNTSIVTRVSYILAFPTMQGHLSNRGCLGPTNVSLVGMKGSCVMDWETA